MALQAVIGSDFTFQVLFLDLLNDPVVVSNPKIDIFMYSQAGAKQFLVEAADLDTATPAEDGRYVYVYTIPISLTDGDLIYAEMTGADPLSGQLYYTPEEVIAISSNRGSGSCPGLIPRFVE